MYADLVEKIKAHLLAGGVIVIATYTKAMQYEKKHVELFKVGADGSPLVRHGKRWDDFRWSSVKFYTYKKES